MSMQDPISDMLTRIRNAQAVNEKQIEFPASKLKVAILTVLQDEGYINSFEELTLDDKKNKKNIRVILKYYLDKPVIEKINITINENFTYCRNGTGKKLRKSLPGTVRALINNAVIGVTKGFEKKLNLVGVGYRAQMKGKVLTLSVGYSHSVEFPMPDKV